MAWAQSGPEFFQHSRVDLAEPVNGCDDFVSETNCVCCVVEKGVTREKPLDSRQQVVAQVHASEVKEEIMSTIYSTQGQV